MFEDLKKLPNFRNLSVAGKKLYEMNNDTDIKQLSEKDLM